jgi:hypothetical protein
VRRAPACVAAAAARSCSLWDGSSSAMAHRSSRRWRQRGMRRETRRRVEGEERRVRGQRWCYLDEDMASSSACAPGRGL